MSKRVYPSDPTLAMWAASPELQKRWATSQANRPYDEYEAAMKTLPFDDPEESTLEQMERWDGVKRAVNALPADHRRVIEGLFFEDRGSLRSVGRSIGRNKNLVARLRDEALDMLAQDPRVVATINDVVRDNSSRD